MKKKKKNVEKENLLWWDWTMCWKHLHMWQYEFNEVIFKKCRSNSRWHTWINNNNEFREQFCFCFGCLINEHVVKERFFPYILGFAWIRSWIWLVASLGTCKLSLGTSWGLWQSHKVGMSTMSISVVKVGKGVYGVSSLKKCVFKH